MQRYMGWGWMDEYGFLGGENVNKDGRHLACLGRGLEPCFGTSVRRRELLRAPFKQVNELKTEGTQSHSGKGSAEITEDHTETDHTVVREQLCLLSTYSVVCTMLKPQYYHI